MNFLSIREIMIPQNIIKIIIERIFEKITPIAVCLEDIEAILNQNKNRMRRVIATNFFERESIVKINNKGPMIYHISFPLSN